MIICTKDGSETIRLDDSGITFHSIHGALQESIHVYIEAGLNYWIKEFPDLKTVRVFEMGFGTGLNALLTARKADSSKLMVSYTCIDNQPLPEEILQSLHYGELPGAADLYKMILSAPWNKNNKTRISQYFELDKRVEDLLSFHDPKQYDIIYFDAFAPTAQPELWTKEVFLKMLSMLEPGGCLVTYCSKSIIRRAMMDAGFMVTKIQGPRGKREMVRAFRPRESNLKS